MQNNIDYNNPFILYENEEFILLYKPSYWSCSTSFNNKAFTKYPENNKFILLFLKFILKINFNVNKDKKNFKYGLMNRLDIETSGCVIVAKNKLGFDKLFNIFHIEKKIKKIYICLTNYNKLDKKQDFFIKPIECIRKFKKKTVSKCFITEKINNKYNSISYYYKILDLIDENNNKYSLFYVVIFTGRTHQIRVHMNSIGCPLVSDPQYLSHNLLKKNKEIINRCFLHNIYYEFDYDNKKLKFTIPLQNDLLGCLEKLKPMNKKNYDVYKIPTKLKKLTLIK